eukprot:GEZU01023079.1.p1 GENE.GEZU01023079.1~~GEZU01023079.1.p1  ORF type:complete len:309 (+),score=34.12 GEZU01023079.1:110-1036(+)
MSRPSEGTNSSTSNNNALSNKINSWSTELRRDRIDMSIEVISKEKSYKNDMPFEVYMTRVYRMPVKLEGWLPPERTNGRKPIKLLIQVQALDCRLAQVFRSDTPSKPIIDGVTCVLLNENEARNKINLKLKFLESNYTKLLKERQNQEYASPPSTPIIPNLQQQQHLEQQQSQLQQLQQQRNYSPTSFTSPYQTESSVKDEALRLKQQFEQLNRDTFEFFRLRVICYQIKDTYDVAIPETTHRNAFIDYSSAIGTKGAAPATVEAPRPIGEKEYFDIRTIPEDALVPIISKISSPFKCYSKKAHAKQK